MCEKHPLELLTIKVGLFDGIERNFVLGIIMLSEILVLINYILELQHLIGTYRVKLQMFQKH
jgi:hypothetical protein